MYSATNSTPKNRYRDSPILSIHAAAATGETKNVIGFLDKGIHVDERADGCTALWYAAHEGFTDTVRALLDRGADVNAVGENNQLPLDVALLNSTVADTKRIPCLETALLLLERGAEAGHVQWSLASFHPIRELNDPQEKIRRLNGQVAVYVASAGGNVGVSQEMMTHNTAQNNIALTEVLLSSQSLQIRRANQQQTELQASRNEVAQLKWDLQEARQQANVAKEDLQEMRLLMQEMRQMLQDNKR